MFPTHLLLLVEVHSCTRGIIWRKYGLNDCNVLYGNKVILGPIWSYHILCILPHNTGYLPCLHVHKYQSTWRVISSVMSHRINQFHLTLVHLLIAADNAGKGRFCTVYLPDWWITHNKHPMFATLRIQWRSICQPYQKNLLHQYHTSCAKPNTQSKQRVNQASLTGKHMEATYQLIEQTITQLETSMFPAFYETHRFFVVFTRVIGPHSKPVDATPYSHMHFL